MSNLIKNCSVDKSCSLYHSSFQKRKLKNSNMISEVGCKCFQSNEDNPLERVINIELNSASQTLIFYWPDNAKRVVIPLEHIVMPFEQIPQDRVVLHIHVPLYETIMRIELRFPTPHSLDRFISYIRPPESSDDSANSSPSSLDSSDASE